MVDGDVQPLGGGRRCGGGPEDEPGDAIAQSRLVVEVRDDGCGFEPAAARGLGLAGLADRMSIVDGTVLVDSAPGRGTTLRVEIPLTESDGGRG
jgi:signal transduction histidine kinase